MNLLESSRGITYFRITFTAPSTSGNKSKVITEFVCIENPYVKISAKYLHAYAIYW